MAQDLIVNGTIYNGVDSLSMINSDGEIIEYIESSYPSTGITVATIGDELYDSVEEALANAVSGNTVIMVANSVENVILYVSSGVTLDLNGKTLTVSSVYAANDSKVLDSLRTGTLKVPQNSVILAKTNSYIPLWDPSSDGYKFTQISITDNSQGMGITKDETTDVVTLTFVPFFRDRNLLLNGNSDNNVEIFVRSIWYDNDKVVQEYIYNSSRVGQVVTANGSQAFAFYLNRMSTLNGLTMQVVVKSGTGVEALGTLFTINN